MKENLLKQRITDLENECNELKRKLRYLSDIWGGLRPLSEIIDETREEYRAAYIKSTGIENPRLEGMRFFEDYK